MKGARRRAFCGCGSAGVEMGPGKRQAGVGAVFRVGEPGSLDLKRNADVSGIL